MWFIVCFNYLFLIGALGQTSNDPPEVTIAQGVVIGSRATDGNYYEFHGIPYADSTSGSNRFKAPSAPPSFKGYFDANRKGIKCVRSLGIGFEGTEDCLVANIFTPSLNATDLLPVMVWIKGKEFDQIYKPELSFTNFMEKDVVIVSLNYRESILGFLCLGTEIAPGNAGLKDIIAGLKWVRNNIIGFGGDPDNISIFGHGSGASAVDLVSLSPMSEGLIHKVITQSGSALSPWAVTRDNIKYAVHVAEALGHDISNIEQLSEVFTRTSITALMAVINELNLKDNSLAFAPCIENENLQSKEQFLLQSPYEILSDSNYISIPFMSGFVDIEGTIRAEEALENDWLEKMQESFVDFLQPDLAFETLEEELAISNVIKQFYFGDEVIEEEMTEYLSYHGDTMIVVSTLREARIRAYLSTKDVYLYQFSYKGQLGKPFVGPLPVDHAAHSEELAYLFRDFNNTQTDVMDLTISDILIERWTNFAKTGIPESETSQIEWEPYTRNNSYYLRILDTEEVNRTVGGTLEEVLEDPHSDTLLFWDAIYEDHFLDAKSRWELIERIEEEEDNGSGEEEDNESGEGEDNGSGEEEDNGNGEEEDNGSGEEEDNGEEEEGSGGIEDGGEDGDGNSAHLTTTTGYTLLTVSFFILVGKLHNYHLIL